MKLEKTERLSGQAVLKMVDGKLILRLARRKNKENGSVLERGVFFGLLCLCQSHVCVDRILVCAVHRNLPSSCPGGVDGTAPALA